MEEPEVMRAEQDEGQFSNDLSALATINKSEIDQQVATAKKYPRSLKRFRDESLQMVTLSEAIASECTYALPREGKVIAGPSARFAEVVLSAWGNARAGARVIGEDEEFITAQGAFYDLERNVAISYEVRRRITRKDGQRYSADMIGVTANAACSIALRNAILKGIPKAFWQTIHLAAIKTAAGDLKTLNTRRAAAIAAFEKYKITEEELCKIVEVPGVEDITIEHLVTLKSLLTGIEEGDVSPERLRESVRSALPSEIRRRSEQQPGPVLTPEQRAEAMRLQTELEKKRAEAPEPEEAPEELPGEAVLFE